MASGVNNTAFSPNPDFTAQLTGSGQPPYGNVNVNATANTTVTSILQYSRYIAITATGVNYNVICANSVVPAGGIVNINCINGALAASTVTWGAGFRANTTTVGVSSKVQMCQFVSDGTTLNMVSQSPNGAE
jgi:hypothetical protein